MAYLDTLSNKMRAQLYHFASRDLPFKAPEEQILRYPQKMSKEEWLEVMFVQWTDLKAHLTIQHEMAFNYAQANFKCTSQAATRSERCAPQTCSSATTESSSRRRTSEAKEEKGSEETPCIPRRLLVSTCVSETCSTIMAQQNKSVAKSHAGTRITMPHRPRQPKAAF